MRVLGVDPSSRHAGTALVVDDELRWIHVWAPSKAGIREQLKLYEYYRWVRQQIYLTKPDMIVVEFMRRGNSSDAVRVVGYYESATLVAAMSMRVPVVKRIQVRTARKHVLGNGNMAKEDVFKVVKKRFSNHSFKRFDGGGSDQADAVVLAIAGPIAENEA